MTERERQTPEPAIDVGSLLARLEEAESTLRAIRDGEVEALVVNSHGEPRVYVLEGSDHRYRRLVETMSEGALLVSGSGAIAYSNAAFAEMVGAGLEHVIGCALADFVAPNWRALLVVLLERAQRSPVAAEVVLLSHGGQERPAYLSLARNSPEEGPGASVIVTDLTDQKRNKEIVASERLANAILEQTAEPIIVCDVDAVVIRASAAARAIGGVNVLGRPFFQAFPFFTSHGDEHPLESALSGHTTPSREVTLSQPGGIALSFLCTAAPLLDDSARILGCVVGLVDITDRKRLELDRSGLLDAERAARALAEHARRQAEASSRAKDEFLATV
ncbi:MAG TPA: PAS domain-containing protein, partial [Polyangiaceae bacterium]|nr:PAS domain-containing protein [Polyangiaceae bacterium]